MQRKDLFVLNDFLKFDRKIYQFAGMKFGRPIALKSMLYFFFFSGGLFVWYQIPIINLPLKALSKGFIFSIPFILTYLLMDIGTEKRSPVSFFQSFVSYHVRQSKKVTYYKGKELEKPKSYGFVRFVTHQPRSDTKKKKDAINTYTFHHTFTYREEMK